MKPEKALKKLKIELSEKYANRPTDGVYDLNFANPPKISDEQLMEYLDLTSGVSCWEMLKDFARFSADFTGLSYLAGWIEEKAIPYTSNLLAKKNRSGFR